MKISLNWLQDYIELQDTPEAVGAALTQTGLEVESIDRIEKIPGSLKNLIVGEIVVCTPHPNADKLKLTQVNTGTGALLPIVCGAPNVALGQKVVVAPVGTTIYPTGGDPFVIKKAKIRGEVSEGMLCAEDEIGLGTSHDGLLILDPAAEVGTLLTQMYDTGEDYVFEIGLTPNRGDAASHLGVARDLRAFYKQPLHKKDYAAADTISENPIRVTVENTIACPRYSGVTIRGIQVGPSPEWLQIRLRSIGLTPINNIVDITNFVLMSLGQPMHAFDADAITGNEVIVKNLPQGTKFKTLDEVERNLDAADLMICNAEGGMCIAGVFGGVDSGIKPTTTSIFLESAFFASDSIRATAMRHSLSTDASFRYERGTDPEITMQALHMAVTMVLELAGGHVASDYIDIYPNPIAPLEIPTTYANFKRLIGVTVEPKRILEILNNLDIETLNITETGFTAKVPPYRYEVTREADLVEEVLRIYGFNNIPLDQAAGTSYLASFAEKEPYKVQEELSHYLAGKGFSEILTNSLTNPKYHTNLNLGGQAVEILNKSSEELGIMKTSPLYTALESVRRNLNRKIKNLNLFEFAKTYELRDNGKYKETENFCILMTGENGPESWNSNNSPLTFFDLSAVAHGVLAFGKIDRFTTEPLGQQDTFDFGLQIKFNNKVVARLGRLQKQITSVFDISQEVYYAEFLWKDFVGALNTNFTFDELSRYPEVRRDLSLVIDKKTSFSEIRDLTFKYEKKLLNRINVFSVYEGDKLAADKKSYAISFFLQDKEKTLTDKVIDKVMNGLINVFEKEIGAIIRK